MPDSALDRLLARRKQFLAFVQRRVRDHATAEDILQAAYVRAWEHQEDLQAGTAPVAWFYRLLRNAVTDSYRRLAVKERALEAWQREPTPAGGTSGDSEPAVCGCLHGTIDGLKPEYADILRAVDLSEQRLQDFAVQQGLSPSNAGVRIHRARAALRKRLLQTCGHCAEQGCLNCTCKHPAFRKA